MSGYWSALARAAGVRAVEEDALAAQPRITLPFESEGSDQLGWPDPQDVEVPAQPAQTAPPMRAAEPSSLVDRSPGEAVRAATMFRQLPDAEPEPAPLQARPAPTERTFAPHEPAAAPVEAPREVPTSRADPAPVRDQSLPPPQPVAVMPALRSDPQRAAPRVNAPALELAQAILAVPRDPPPEPRAQPALATPAITLAAQTDQAAAAVQLVPAATPAPIVITIDQLDIRMGDVPVSAPVQWRERPGPVIGLDDYLRAQGDRQ